MGKYLKIKYQFRIIKSKLDNFLGWGVGVTYLGSVHSLRVNDEICTYSYKYIIFGKNYINLGVHQ